LSIHGLPADPHSTASSQLNWLPRRFKWTRPFLWKTKFGLCACTITFQTCSTYRKSSRRFCSPFELCLTVCGTYLAFRLRVGWGGVHLLLPV